MNDKLTKLKNILMMEVRLRERECLCGSAYNVTRKSERVSRMLEKEGSIQQMTCAEEIRELEKSSRGKRRVVALYYIAQNRIPTASQCYCRR